MAISLPPAALQNAATILVGSEHFQQVVNVVPASLMAHKSLDFATVQSGSVVWSVGVAKTLYVSRAVVMAGSSTGGVVTLFFAASGPPIGYQPNTGTVVFRGELAPSATAKPGVVQVFNFPISAEPNDALRIQSTAASQLYVVVDGFEL